MQVHKTFDVTLFGAFHVMQFAGRKMAAQPVLLKQHEDATDELSVRFEEACAQGNTISSPINNISPLGCNVGSERDKRGICDCIIDHEQSAIFPSAIGPIQCSKLGVCVVFIL